MIILTKRRYCFRNGAEKIETIGGGAIETVPDWVAKTELFELAAAGGNIMEIADKSRKVTEEAPAKKSGKDEEPKVEEKSGAEEESKAEKKPAARKAAAK